MHFSALWSALFLLFCLDVCGQRWQYTDSRAIPLTPAILAKSYKSCMVDEDELQQLLFNIPAGGRVINIPLPDGSVQDFLIHETPVMAPELAANYPGIKTFTGISTADAKVTAKIDFTLYGFHAVIFDGEKTSLVDPYDNSRSGYYLVRYKKDETRHWTEPTKCFTTAKEPATRSKAISTNAHNGSRTVNGYVLRTFRLALACSHQYAEAVTGQSQPVISQVLSKMVTSVNRVNGVYEREFSVSMVLIPNDTLLIFTNPNNDPYGADNSDPDPYLLLSENQITCDNIIGDTSYDFGHVFTTGGGGLSSIGVVCHSGQKAMSETGQPNPVGDGFDIDYVAHEMGHEFGATHPFNDDSAGSCSGNAVPEFAYEPGSGSTIMAYAGICAPDDIQPHSDAYFHAVSLMQIQYYIANSMIGCGTSITTNNKLVAVPPFSASYNIPYLTPFELTAPTAVDSIGDSSTTYCWEEWDLGDFGKTLSETHYNGPIFRSYLPTTSPTRIFPKDTMVLAGVLSNAGNEDAEGEKVPDVGRQLHFILTLRDIYNGTGCFLIPDDTILLIADTNATGKGFTVTSQGDSDAFYLGNTTHNVTWNVVATNQAPVNASDVDIFLSDDGGYTWKYSLGTYPNTGSASVTFPNPPVDLMKARIKVKGSGNVFFNVNKYNFGLAHSDTVTNFITIYPVPAHGSIHIDIGSLNQQAFSIFNTLGQLMLKDIVYGEYNLNVSLWPRGLYLARFIDGNGHHTVKKFIVE